MPKVFSPRDLVSRPDKMDETVLHTEKSIYIKWTCFRNGSDPIKYCRQGGRFKVVN